LGGNGCGYGGGNPALKLWNFRRQNDVFRCMICEEYLSRGLNMGILISNAALTTTLAAARNSDLPATLSATYAAARVNQPGMTYVENGRELVAFLRSKGWPLGRDLRIQWAPSPPAPTATVNEVRNAISNLDGVRVHSGPIPADSVGAQAYTSGNSTAFGSNPSHHTMGHEATHVVQHGAGGGNMSGVNDTTVESLMHNLRR
jgi:hypothetical protein